jgi:hypothetical protein
MEDDDILEYFPPVINAIGVAGSSWKIHNSGARSFDLTCTAYNFDAPFGKAKQSKSGRQVSKTVDFTLRCFFDAGLRFGYRKQPQPGSLIHVIGQLCGAFEEKELGSQCPAILITDFDIITLPQPNNMSLLANSTPTNTQMTPRTSRIRYRQVTNQDSPITPPPSASSAKNKSNSNSELVSPPTLMSTLSAEETEESEEESSEEESSDTIPVPAISAEVVDDTISDVDDAPRSSKRRRIPTSKVKSMEE